MLLWLKTTVASAVAMEDPVIETAGDGSQKLRARAWNIIFFIKLMLVLNCFGLLLTSVSNIYGYFQKSKRKIFYDLVLLIACAGSLGTMAADCNHERQHYKNERFFGEDCAPSNSFFFCYIFMCFMWLLRPIEILFIITGPNLGSRALQVRVQFSMMMQQLPIILSILFGFVLLGMSLSFMTTGYSHILEGVYTLIGDSLIPDHTLAFYEDSYWLWGLAPIVF